VPIAISAIAHRTTIKLLYNSSAATSPIRYRRSLVAQN